ncbi:prepilin-type N-terminal cleavage/methylation domain-containing protein [bacterium]|nr:prepilin-type N-terminal cleavage/methylation domain-containing protein [bacterium]
MDKKYNNKNDGFSLMEIIVVIFIIALFSGSLFANYKQGNNTNKLIIEANILASNIRLAQNNTLGAVKYGTSTPSGGWGIHIDLASDNNSYYVFANKNYESDGSLGYDFGESIIGSGGRVIDMDGEIKIASTSVGNILDISFVPPDPDTIIYDGTATYTEAVIMLETKEGISRRIKISSFGLIETLR